MATNCKVFAYNHVNEISVLEKKIKQKDKKKTNRPKDANTFRTWIKTEQAAG